ncbi:MAG: XRE family transcriptional regulator [Marinomonas sp.]
MTVQINPTALRSVRQQRALAINSVAEFTKISANRISEFESGERSPTYKQVSRLAKLYGVPSYLLAIEGVPNVPPPPHDYRKPTQESAELTPQGLRTILQTERLSEFSGEMLGINPIEQLDLETPAKNAEDPISSANLLREAFDNWFKPRREKLGFAGSNVTQTISALKLFAECHGRVARTDDAPPKDYMGFYIEPEVGLPSIYINRKISSKKAQLFTLMHEYSHALMNAEGISDPFVLQNDIERRCNRFAAEFIAPEAEVRKIVEGIGRTARDDPQTLTETISRRSFLSKQASAVRAFELGFINQTSLTQMLELYRFNRREEKTEEQLEESNEFGWQHAKRIAELGHLSIYLAKVGIDKDQIDKVDVKQSISLAFPTQEKAFDLAARRIEAALSS